MRMLKFILFLISFNSYTADTAKNKKSNASDMFSKLLQDSGGDLNKKDTYGHVPLFYIMENMRWHLSHKDFDLRKEVAIMIVNHKNFDQKESG
ncbi:MAG TPA: hypothetical protein VEK38_01705, partial [Candidatus Bathyarchaeia archaeon]|nr:hypothetical protein [Candidatus Bathyarchaeia archaeon]